MNQAMEKQLILTPEQLAPAYKKEIPTHPRFFHFHPNLNPVAFQEAEIIIFRVPGKPDYVIKDTFNKLGK